MMRTIIPTTYLLLMSAERVSHESIQNRDKNKNKIGIGVNLVFKV